MLITLHAPADPELLAALLEGVIAGNRVLLRRFPYPSVYRARVRWVMERKGHERWQTLDQVLARGEGDCEDLVGWRVAELREQGDYAAAPLIIPTSPKMLHVIVVRGDGAIEDPSIAHGMPVPRSYHRV